MTSCEPLRSRAYSEDLKWRMIYQREMLGLTCARIAENLNVDTSTVWRAIHRFEEEGTIAEKKHAGGRKLSELEMFTIIEYVIDNPAAYLREIQHHIETTTGTIVTESAICRFLQRNNFSRKKLANIALQRSTELCAEFVRDCSVYSPDMLVFVDESGCDRRCTMRRFGYALKGLFTSSFLASPSLLPPHHACEKLL